MINYYVKQSLKTTITYRLKHTLEKLTKVNNDAKQKFMTRLLHSLRWTATCSTNVESKNT